MNDIEPVDRAARLRRATLETMETAYIGLGANLPSLAGPPEATLAEAVEWLSELGRVTHRSSLYSTEPVGYADQPRFVNAVVALETGLSPRHLLDELLRIERAFGRDRSSGLRNGPRTLDLDLLLYGDQVVSAAGLELPHPRLPERAFVLVPLAEIASNLMDAARGLTVAAMLENLRARFPSESDAIVRFTSDSWRPCSVADGGDSAGDSSSDAHR